mmetsp:Transcript_62421/g.71703  ORF Transcript_62421/g.71703 Transcript_62421/m.71703 type:complete len:488 (+) Transcript_62421:82-1545(+)
MDTTNNNRLRELKESILKIKDLETEMVDSKWIEEPSPRATFDFQNSLLERYQEAKSLYMQRRLESIMVDQVSTFDPTSNEFDTPNTCGDNVEIEEKNAKAVASLETAAQGIRASISNMRNSYQAVCSRRVELEQMIQDIEQDDGNDADTNDDQDQEMVDTDGKFGSEEEVVSEREKIDVLQQRKRQLQGDLTRLVKEKEDRLSSIVQSREELVLLKEEESKILESGQDPTQFHEKIKELKEMKEFYDSLREVTEELGGVKILKAREDNESKHLFLNLVIYDEHQIEIELEVYRKSLLKLINAKWVTNPIVSSMKSLDSQVDDKSKTDEVVKREHFSLPLYPMDDLVQVAKTSMGPPHDMRFVIRETCARIRNTQNRVDDIAILRKRVLTRVVGNDQVVCSLNEGIVIDMRLYDQWVEVEQIVGVTGWEKETTDKIHKVVSRRDESWTPSVVVNLVQKEIERLKEQDGLEIPKTPVMPSRQKERAQDK